MNAWRRLAARTRELEEANGRLTILDRSKSDFLNLISHEFRTPLNGPLGASLCVGNLEPPGIRFTIAFKDAAVRGSAAP